MVVFRVISRSFHITRPVLQSEMSLLATLRKKTGYTFSNCKKALQLHENNLIEAEKWLKEQAQALGWAKAIKLEGRQTLQGLIGVAMTNKNAVLVEVNCETDFVAKNREFQNIVQLTTDSCLKFAEHQQSNNRNFLTKLSLDNQQLKQIQANDGKPLADHLALMIGNVGENATLRRAFCLKVPDDSLIQLACYAHPSTSSQSGNDGILLGKFGGLVAFKQTAPPTDGVDVREIGREICQHIVGMNPKKIGNENDEPAERKDEEVCLIHQEFLLDETLTVKEVLDENNLEVCFFKRFECGENLNVELLVDENLKFIETCQ